MVSHELILAHLQDRVSGLALHRHRFAELTDEEWTFFLQQIEGYQRTKDKLPTFAALNSKLSTLNSPWWYPPRISCEQCSSEATAKYKAQVIASMNTPLWHLIDLTGGAGVDTYFMGEQMETVDYVERNAELCRLAEHNLPDKVRVHNKTAEAFLATLSTLNTKHSIIYIDPARRDKNGGKVFRIEDCTPNVVELLPRMREIADTIMIKFSPMLDISTALCRLDGPWQAHVVAVKNEVKEVLLLSSLNSKFITHHSICAVDLAEGWQFEFTHQEEDNATSPLSPATCNLSPATYLYEPNAAILKAGAYKLVGARYGLTKLDVNTHLYHSEQLVQDFPGRIFKIVSEHPEKDIVRNEPYNVLTRNYVMGAEELKKKLKVRDGGTQYIIGTRAQGKPIMLLCDRIK